MIRELEDASFKGRMLTGCEKWVAGMADALVTVSQAEAERLKAKGVGCKEAFRVIHNGIDLSYFSTKAVEATSSVVNDQRLSLGYIGSLTPEKGVEVLLQSAALLKQCRSDFRLYLLGDGHLLESLRAQAVTLGLEQEVCFVGEVDDVRPWLKAFDLMVVPSLSEGFGRVVIEALAMERPVVASRVGGIPEVMGEEMSEMLVPVGDPEALAVALERLLADPDLRRIIGKQGRSQVESRFSIDGMLDGVDRLYTELLERKGRL